MAYTRGGVRFLVFYADKRICILLAMGVDDFGVVSVIYRISIVYLSYIYRSWSLLDRFADGPLMLTDRCADRPLR